VWEPLLAVADAAGGHWPERARTACVALLQDASAGDQASLGVRLLTDLRDKVFCGVDRMPTAAILEVLLGLDDAPWSDMSEDGQNTKPLTARGLSKLLSQYVRPDITPIKPRGIRVGAATPKGYYAEDLADAWMRYCPLDPQKSATSATSATSQVNGGESVADTPSETRHMLAESDTRQLRIAG
jgi:hypothetical protein